MNAQKSIPCRVCGAASLYCFERTLKGRLVIHYYKCPGCGHAQTEAPTWLAETYREATFELDVGMAFRSLWTAQTTGALAWKLNVDPATPSLDWGGGTGLFVRFCRDFGLNYFYLDPYSENIFARGFEFDRASAPPELAFVSAFEVAEHFPEPVTNFGELFALRPRHVIFSTTLYQGQGADWWYFGEDGQHVAFYTRRSLEIVGEKHGYHLASNGLDLHLFSRDKVSDHLLKTCRKKRVKYSDKYASKHQSRMGPDFEEIVRRYRARAQSTSS